MSLPRLDGVRRAISCALLSAGLLVLSVCGDPVAPGGAARGPHAQFAFAPQFRPGIAAALDASSFDIDNVHIVIKRDDGSVVLDTIVTFPAGVDEVTLNAVVPLAGLTEQFSALIQLRSGNTVLFEGTQQIEAHAGVTNTPTVTVPVGYVGPGATATRVTIAPRALTLNAGASQQLDAKVFDASGIEITGVPLVWTSSDPSIATVTQGGLVTALSRRGSAAITVELLSGLTDVIDASVVLPPANIRVISGGGQTGGAGQVLAQSFVVEVDAADGVPSPGVTVNFRALVPGATVTPASVVTGVDGRASVLMTLGGQIGAQTFEASALTFAAVPVSETVVPGPAAQLAIISGNTQSDTVGRTLLPFVVRVTDAFGNAVSGATVSWQRAQGSGTLSAPTSTTNANGQASITYTLGQQAGAETIQATSAGQSVVFSATAIPRPASRVTVVSGTPQTGVVGTATQPLVALVTDALGNPVPNVSVSWAVSGTATVASPSSISDASGRVSISAGFGTVAGSSTVFASFAAGSSAQFALTATAGPATSLAIVAGNAQSAASGAPVAIAPSVRLVDSFGNGVSGTVTFAVTGGGGSVTGSSAATDATGLATLGAWTMGAPGPQTMTATSGSFSVTFTATSTAAGSPQLSITLQPNVSQQNALAFTTQPQIQLKDAAGANVLTAGVPVTVALQSGGQTLGSTLTVNTNASGIAVFVGVTITGTVGSNNLVFSSPGYTPVTSLAITVTPGVPTQMAAVTAVSFAGTVGTAATPVPTVILKDVSNNAVPGQTITFAVPNILSGVVVGGAAVTTAAGTASPTSWTLNATAGADTLTATFAGVTGNPVTFVATTSAGAATQIVIVSGDAQTATEFTALPLPLLVEARDAGNNPVSGVNITFTQTVGAGTPVSQVIATNGLGQASFAYTLGAAGGHSVQACLPGCTAQVLFNALAIPVGASAIWTGATSTDWWVASNWSPASVPTGASNVFIPFGTANPPSLTAPAAIADLTMAAGTVLNTLGNNLTLSGNLAASAIGIANGTVIMMGAGKQVSGAVNALTISGGSVTAVGTVTITTLLLIQSNGVFNVASGTISAQTLDLESGGHLVMTGPGSLGIAGNATFNATDQGTDMTAGTLSIGGDLTASSCCTQAFRATGTHLTRLIGATLQTVSMWYGGDANSRFENLDIANAAGVIFARDAYAHGTVTVTNNTPVTGGSVLYAGGATTSAAGTSLAGLSALWVYAPTTTAFPVLAGVSPPLLKIGTGTALNIPAGLPPLTALLDVRDGASVNVGANTLTTAGLTIETGGSFEVGSGTTVANGPLDIESGGRLRMSGAGTLTVTGNATFNGTDQGNDMLAGTLNLKGDLTATSCCTQAFRAVGTHLTSFTGTTPQSVSVWYAGDANSRFENLDLANSAGVIFVRDAVAHGSVTVTNNTPVTGGNVLYAGGATTSTAGTSLAGLSALWVYAPTTTAFPVLAGTSPPILRIGSGNVLSVPASLPVLTALLDVRDGTTVNVGANTLTTGGLTIETNGIFDAGSGTTVANGPLDVESGGHLKMGNAAGNLTITGNSIFNGTDQGTDMSAGTLTLKGDLTATSCCTQAFRAVGTHLTRFNGAAAQTVSMWYGGDANSRFENLDLANAAGVIFARDAVAHGTVSVTNNTPVTGGSILYAGGATTSAAGTSLAGLSALWVYAPTTTAYPVIAGVSPPVLRVGSGNALNVPAGLPAITGLLDVRDGTTVNVGANSLTSAGLTIESGGIFDAGSGTVQVNGALDLESGGRLKMASASATLTVTGNALFNGTDQGNDMSAGMLDLKGDLTATSCCTQAFRAVGNHVTRFSGTALQSISMWYGGSTNSTFQNLDITNASGAGVTLARSVNVNGNMTQSGKFSDGGSNLTIVGGITLGPSSTTTATGTLTAASCLFVTGAVYSGFSCAAGFDAIWTGVTNGNWTQASNWNPAAVPGAASNVFIPVAGNAPTLLAPASIHNIQFAAGAQMQLSGQTFTVNGNFLASGATINGGGGTIAMTTTATSFSGTGLPAVSLQVAGISAVGTTSVASLSVGCGIAFDVGAAQLTVNSGVTLNCSGNHIDMSGAGALTVNGNLDYNGGSYFTMTNGGAHFTITGNVFGDNLNMGDADLTAGLLEIKGNLSTGGTGSQIFRAAGSHTTRFSGSGAQSASYNNPGSSGSRFQNVEFTGGNVVTFGGTLVAEGTVVLNNNTTLNGSNILYAGSLATSTLGTSMAGIARLEVYGAGAVLPLIAGTGPPLITLNSGGSVTSALGTLTIPTVLSIINSTHLDVGGTTINVASDFSYNNGAYFTMTNGAGHLTIGGNMFGDNLNMGDADLTAGLLELKGNLSTGGTGSQIFRAVGTHTTRFSGSGPQSASYNNPASNGSRFQNVEFVGGNTVTLGGALFAEGTVLLNNNTTLTGANIFYTASLATSTAGTSMAGIARLEVYGAGAILPQLAGTGPPLVTLNSGGSVTSALGTLTVPTTLSVINSTHLDIGTTTINIANDFSYNSGAYFTMTNGAGHLTIGGNVFGDNLNMGDTYLTAGLLELKGNLSTGGTGSQIFRAAGTHTTRFSGSGAQSASYNNPASVGSRFQNVEFTGGNIVTFGGNLVAEGTVVLNNNTTLTGANVLFTASLATSTSGTSMAGISRLELYGTGAILPQLAGTGPPLVTLNSGGSVTSALGTLTLPTTLSVINSTHLDIGTTTINIANDFSYNSGAYFTMTNGAGHLTIGGNVFGDNLNMGDTFLTAGLLELKGNLSTGGTGSQVFRAVGTHTTRFSGSGAQSASYNNPASVGSRFQNVEFTGGNTVTLGGALVAEGTVVLNNNTTLTGANVFYTASLATSTAGTSMAGITRLELYGTGAILPQLAGTGPPLIALNSGGAITSAVASNTVTSSISIIGSTHLDVNNDNITVAGNFSYDNGAYFTMTGTGQLTVNGDVFGDNLNMGDTYLTSGTLEIKGNLTTGGTGGQIFRATGTHTTKLSGTGAQSISYNNPGSAGARFQNLLITNLSGAGVSSAGHLYAAGNVTQNGRLTVQSGHLFTIAGNLTLGSGSFTTAIGSLTFAACTNNGASGVTGIICP